MAEFVKAHRVASEPAREVIRQIMRDDGSGLEIEPTQTVTHDALSPVMVGRFERQEIPMIDDIRCANCVIDGSAEGETFRCRGILDPGCAKYVAPEPLPLPEPGGEVVIEPATVPQPEPFRAEQPAAIPQQNDDAVSGVVEHQE